MLAFKNEDDDDDIEETKQTSVASRALCPLPKIDTFIGYNCRTYAIVGVMKWLYDTKRITHAPLPARKMDFFDQVNLSLREIAKTKYHSAVGEVYNIKDLAALAEENQDIHAQYVTCANEDEYIRSIMAAVDANQAPIIFFDADDRGSPGKFQGKYEHAAAVVGYEVYANEKVIFTVSQYGRYDQLDARDLYQSSMQLLRERSGEDLYCKVNSYRNGRSGWVPLYSVQEHGGESRVVNVKQATSPTYDGGYAGKILLLQEKPQLALNAVFNFST